MGEVNWKKVGIVGLVAGTGFAGAEYVRTDTVDVVQLVVTVLGALLTFLMDSRKKS